MEKVSSFYTPENSQPVQFFHDGGGADVQYARGIAHAIGVHRHLDKLLFDRRRLTGVGILQQQGPSTPLEAGTAPRALRAFRGHLMSDNIGPWAVGAGQHLEDHHVSHSS
jgi:hypothetical protein